MSVKHLILQNVKKNIKHYFLYVFALTFSVALYFAFVTLQYDSSMDQMKKTVNGTAAVHAGSIILVFIVMVFLLYANNLFIKRRGKEIGLFQLIGMTKGRVFWILSAENFILYVASLFFGIFLGFSVSKLIVMILFKVTGIEAINKLRFAPEALTQTLVVFAIIYVCIMLINYLFVRRQSILSLFQATAKTEEKAKNLSVLTIIIGVCGIGLIFLGYYFSTKLFSGDFAGYRIFYAMIAISCSVIIGTYLFYKGFVSLIFHLIRKKKDGYLTLNNVLSLSTIMFRMKSNALLLTIITTISAFTIGLLSLTYISYYSAEKTAKQMVPNHFSVFDEADAEKFKTRLEENNIAYTTHKMNVLKKYFDVTQALVPGSYDKLELKDDPRLVLAVISDQSIANINVSTDEVVLTKPADLLGEMLSFKKSGSMTFIGEKSTIELNYIGMEESSILPLRLTDGFPVAIVDDHVYRQLANNPDPSIQNAFSVYIGVDIKHTKNLKKANDIFHELALNKWTGKWTGFESQLELETIQKQSMGLTMFIAGFLGLSFLATSGCILYFKQMDESEAEKLNYTILRKLGFTQGDLLNGIRIKQMINFGIPLVLGLSHSYFVVKSGWFLFGSEMWTPMITIMILYTALYSIYGLLSVLYYKRVIKEAL